MRIMASKEPSRKRKGPNSAELVSNKRPRTNENTEGEPSRGIAQTRSKLNLTSIEGLDNVVFNPYKIAEEYTAFKHCFSDGTIGYRQMTVSGGSGTTKLACKFLDILKKEVPVDLIECNLFASSAAVSESEMFFDVVTNYIQKLGKVTLNPDYKRFLVEDYVPTQSPGSSSSELVSDCTGSTDDSTNQVTCGPIGIGDRLLWWGEPDALVRPLDKPLGSTLFVATSPNLDDSDNLEGDSSLFEAKQNIKSAHLPQAILTAIIHSFTQNKRHPHLNAMVPVVLINGNKFNIVLYDCCKDILLVSTEVIYKHNNQVTQLGTLVLWLVINHRKYFMELKDNRPFIFGLKEYAEKYNLLNHLQQLDKTSINWMQIKRPDSPTEEPVSICTLECRSAP